MKPSDEVRGQVMKDKRNMVSVYLDPDTLAALWQKAAIKQKSKAATAAEIIRENLIQSGYLKEKKNEVGTI